MRTRLKLAVGSDGVAGVQVRPVVVGEDGGDEFAAAAHAGLGEDRLEVVLHGEGERCSAAAMAAVELPRSTCLVISRSRRLRP